MRKIIIGILLSVLFLCSYNKTSEEKTENQIETKIEETKTIDVWDFKLEERFDNVDTWLTTRYAFPDIATSGAEYISRKGLKSYAVTFNRDDFYNSKKQYPFVIESYQKGGAMLFKNGYIGIVNPKGEITLDTKHSYFTHQLYGVRLDCCLINGDFSIDYVGEHGLAGGAGGFSTIFLNEDGEVLFTNNQRIDFYNTIFSLKKIDLFDLAVENGYTKEDDYILINTYASYYDCKYVYNKIELPKNLLWGYFLINKDGFVPLDIADNYQVIDFSDDIIAFAGTSTNILSTINHTSLNDLVGLSQHYYSFELYCDQYEYNNYIYVDTNGKIIADGFEDGYGFYEGYGAVCKNGKWGYIDKQGNVVVDFIFDKTTPISDGKAWVIYNGVTGKLNIKELLENNITINDDILSKDTYSFTVEVEK